MIIKGELSISTEKLLSVLQKHFSKNCKITNISPINKEVYHDTGIGGFTETVFEGLSISFETETDAAFGIE
jgi:hypothetical protein